MTRKFRTYERLQPCGQCGTHTRYANNNNCVHCRREAVKRSEATRAKAPEFEDWKTKMQGVSYQ